MIPLRMRQIVHDLPDAIYAMYVNYANLYSIPRGNSIRIVPCGRDWMVIHNGTKLLSPRGNHLGADLAVFKRRFEAVFPILPTDPVLDVGANIGDTSVPFAMKAQSVIAVEPEPNNARCLRHNLLPSEDSVVVQKAAWDEKEKKRFYIDEHITGHSFFSNAHASFRMKYVEVEADTLDNIVANVNKKVSFLRLDVQGAELNALKGVERLLDVVKKIVVETHIMESGSTAPEVIRFLSDRGFKMAVQDELYRLTGTEFQIVHAWTE